MCCLSHAFVLPQTDGGYLGPDIHTFVSAVFSGAAGVYISTLDHDAGISTLLTVTPGQSVSVTGDPSFAPVPSGPYNYNMRDAPLWGSGSFAVQERGSLALTVLGPSWGRSGFLAAMPPEMYSPPYGSHLSAATPTSEP